MELLYCKNERILFDGSFIEIVDRKARAFQFSWLITGNFFMILPFVLLFLVIVRTGIKNWCLFKNFKIQRKFQSPLTLPMTH